MAVKANGVNVPPNTIAGIWKFHYENGLYSTSVAELANTAEELVNKNIGGGVFREVFIRNTSPTELGICFVYELGPKEKATDEAGSKEWREPYTDFFYRRHGITFKGYDIGHSITEIILEAV